MARIFQECFLGRPPHILEPVKNFFSYRYACDMPGSKYISARLPMDKHYELAHLQTNAS